MELEMIVITSLNTKWDKSSVCKQGFKESINSN